MKTLMLAIGLLLLSSAAHAATIALNPQPGVVLLGVSCGGIHTSTYVTGFNDAGNIMGEVYAWTRCGGSGRGGGYRSKLYFSWHSIVWDLTGRALVTLPYDGIVPDPAFTETDAAGNTIHTVAVPGGYQGLLETP